MTPEQIALVRTSMAAVDDRDDLVRAFYDRLFELAPDTRALFPQDMARLRSSFLATLTELVASLDQVPDLALHSMALGARHRGYGVHAAHFVVQADPSGHARVGEGEVGMQPPRNSSAQTSSP